MRAASGSADVVWNGRSEQLSGVLALDLKQAIDTSAASVPIWSLKTAGSAEKVTLDAANLQAIVFSPVLRRPLRSAVALARIDLRDGSRLNVISLERQSDGRITVTLADRRKLEAVDMSRQFSSAIVRIAGQPSRVTWVSSLEPARYRFMDERGELAWPLGRDQDLFGKPLFVDDDSVAHAVVLHSPAQVAYRWDGRKAKFLCEVSIARPATDLATSVGSAQCRVLVARDGQLVELLKTSTVRPGDRPLAIDVDISDAQLVVLLAEEADQGSVGDHVLWRDARFVLAETQP
jgi:hypothetical protein